mgnify:CR=1 FL=1
MCNVHYSCLELPDTCGDRSSKGPFNKYVDMMRGGGGQKKFFCPLSGYKNCPRKGRGGGGVAKLENSVHVGGG